MPKRKMVGPCSVVGCGRPIDSVGLCQQHYLRKWKYGSTGDRPKSDGRRKHPFYHLWFERKQAKILCKEWLDFPTFVRDISPKPDGNFFLVRRGDELLGPINFQWIEHLKKKRTETNKEWWARKWAARQLNNPGMERGRMFRRKYGMTTEQYEKIHADQNGQCAVCGNPETSIDGKTGTRKNLSVDHCHKTLKIRGLLCFRCNSTIGKIDESLELLRSLERYLKEHQSGIAA